MQALAGSLQRLQGEEGLCGCLDALLTTMLECESTQARFVQLQGVERVTPFPCLVLCLVLLVLKESAFKVLDWIS